MYIINYHPIILEKSITSVLGAKLEEYHHLNET